MIIILTLINIFRTQNRHYDLSDNISNSVYQFSSTLQNYHPYSGGFKEGPGPFSSTAMG